MGKILHYSHFKKERYHKNSEASILTFVRLKPQKKKKKKKKRGNYFEERVRERKS